MMDASRDDVLAYMDFPRDHWARIASTNSIERLNGEIERRSDDVGRGGRAGLRFPNDRTVVRLVGASMLEQNDERAVCRRHMRLEGPKPVLDDPLIERPAVAA